MEVKLLYISLFHLDVYKNFQKLADALFDGRTISFQHSKDPLKSIFAKSKREKFRLFRIF